MRGRGVGGRVGSCSTRRRVAFLKSNDLYVAETDGRDAKRLTSGLGMQDAPAWSADGRSLVVSAGSGEWRLAAIPDLEAARPAPGSGEADPDPGLAAYQLGLAKQGRRRLKLGCLRPALRAGSSPPS